MLRTLLRSNKTSKSLEKKGSLFVFYHNGFKSRISISWEQRLNPIFNLGVINKELLMILNKISYKFL
jgi:hypothetical protein